MLFVRIYKRSTPERSTEAIVLPEIIDVLKENHITQADCNKVLTSYEHCSLAFTYFCRHAKHLLGKALRDIFTITVEPRYNEGPRDWQNVFAITRFRYIEVLSHTFYYYWDEECRSLYRGLRYIEVRYIEVALYYEDAETSE